MEDEYVTIKTAMQLTGKSTETIRRWIRLIRSSYTVDLDDTNQDLEESNAPLRKQNVRMDKHGVQQFEWLLSTTTLLESFPRQEEPQPPTQKHAPAAMEGLQPSDKHPQDDLHINNGDPRDDTQETPHHSDAGPHEYGHKEPPSRFDYSQEGPHIMNIDKQVWQTLVEEIRQKNNEINQLHVMLRSEQLRTLPAPTKPFDDGTQGENRPELA